MTSLPLIEAQLIGLRYDLLDPLTSVISALQLLQAYWASDVDRQQPMQTVGTDAQCLINTIHTIVSERGVLGYRLLHTAPSRVESRAADPALAWAWSLPLDAVIDRLVAELRQQACLIQQECCTWATHDHGDSAALMNDLLRLLDQGLQRFQAVVDTLPARFQTILP
jgi:hypothetical protein